MNIFVFKVGRLPGETMRDVAAREKQLRKARRFTQTQLAEKAGVSLGSLRRFEQTGQISFESLVRIGVALNCEDDFEALFAKRAYRSIQEVIDEQRASSRR